MDDITMLIKVLSKGESIATIKQFNVKVHGFQRNFERAPVDVLKSFLSKELKRGVNQKSRGKKRTTIDQVYIFISSSFLKENPEFKELSIEEIALKLEIDLEFSKATALSILYTQFSDVYKKHRDLLEKNIEQNQSLFNGIVLQTSNEEKLRQLVDQTNISKAIYTQLQDLIDQVKKDEGDDFFVKISKKINENGEESFLNQTFMIPKKRRHIPMLAFLVENDRYLESKYNDILLFVFKRFEENQNKRTLKKIDELKNEINLNKKEIDDYKEMRVKVKEMKKTNDNLENQFIEISDKFRDAKSQLSALNEKLNKIQPFSDYFEYLLNKNQVFIVSSDFQLFHGTPLQKFLLESKEFDQLLRSNRVSKYQSKYIFITRVSYISTSEWLKTKRLLENYNFWYFELSGYSLEDYIAQIVEQLHKERKYVSL